MATQEIIQAPELGEHGEPCASCGAPLAADQRYCLNCGHGRGPARVPFAELARDRRTARVREQAAGAPAPLVPQPLVLVAAAAAVLMVLLLGLGVLIGAIVAGDERAAAAPQVIQVGNAGTGAGAADGAGADAENASFSEDWPSGKKGYTVQVQELAKEESQSADVAKAKAAAEEKGAKDVGALDTDNYASLDAGAYIVYSGVYDDKKGAQRALAGLKKDFRQARVVLVDANATEEIDEDAFSGKKKEATVSRDQLKTRENLSPAEAQKQSNKIADQTKIAGKAPPKQKEKTSGFDTEIK